VFATGEGRRTAQVLVTRSSGSHGAASVNVGTIGGSAQAASDFRRTTARVRSTCSPTNASAGVLAAGSPIGASDLSGGPTRTARRRQAATSTTV
jgi:hypothetical protein